MGGVAAWPLAARAAVRQDRSDWIPGAPLTHGKWRGLRLGLRDLGYVEGKNIVIAFRWAAGNYARLPELAGELIRSNVDVIVTHGTPGSVAAKQPQPFP
jgi:putative tryptophan/tyrosine transport system substrate-binding protein